MENIIYDLFFSLIFGSNTEKLIELLANYGSFKEIYNHFSEIKHLFSQNIVDKIQAGDFSLAISEYEKCYGPITRYNVESTDKWTWICEPWPWEGV